MTQRIALGLSYVGNHYLGWQSQPNGQTVQDVLEAALSQIAQTPIRTHVAGRTDTGVHALMQVLHFNSPTQRPETAWVRGVNALLPDDIAVQWSASVPDTFHSRGCAMARRYSYVLLQSPVRPSVEHGRVGWTFQTLSEGAMQEAAQMLIGTHDFSSFRAAQCQALSPIKTVTHIGISQRGAYWRFDFEASAFLHHMIRNIMGCLIQIGSGRRPVPWMQDVLAAKSRVIAAPTFSPAGLYFVQPIYGSEWGLPSFSPNFDALPGGMVATFRHTEPSPSH